MWKGVGGGGGFGRAEAMSDGGLGMHGNELREWSTGEGLGVLRPWELREWSALWVFTDAAPAPAGVGG